MSDSLPPSSTASSSPPASDATAPLLIPEDLHSLSSSSSDAGGGHASDWSSPSPSPSANASDNDEEEIEEFDLLASQELPSDHSSTSNSSKNHNDGSRLSLSFPDPLTSVEPLEPGPLSPSSSNPSSKGQRVRADLDNSILVDGGAYSLLLDAPTTQSPPFESQEDEETTSTPPPALQPQPSPRTPFSRSSTIIRAKPTSISTKDAEDKVGKWRSTLLDPAGSVPPSSSSLPPPQSPNVTSPASSAILLSLPPSIDSSQTLGEGGGGISSVTSSQTVIASIKPASRGSTPPLLDIDEKKSDNFEEKVNNLPKKLDELIEKSSRGGGGGLGGRGGVRLKRLMSVLTVMGIVLAGIASFKIRELKGSIISIPKLESPQVSQESSIVSSPSMVLELIASPSSSSSVITTTSTLQHTLPTAKPPLSLASTLPPQLPPASSIPTPIYTLDAPSPPPPDDSRDQIPHFELKDRMLSHAARCVDLERRVEVRFEGRREKKLKRRIDKTRRRTLLETDSGGQQEGQTVWIRIETERERGRVGWKEGFGNAWRFFKEDLQGVRERLSGRGKKGSSRKGRKIGFAEGMGRAWSYFKEDVGNGFEMVRDLVGIESSKGKDEEDEKMRVKFRIIEGLKGLPPRPRLSRYPVVRDYFRSMSVSKSIKLGIKSNVKEPSKSIGRFFKGVGKRVGELPRGRALKVKGRAKGMVEFVKRQGRDVRREAEIHVYRAARTVQFLEKEGGWKELKRRRREKHKREKRERKERKERKEREKKRR